VVRIGDKKGFNWRAIAKELEVPVMTPVDAYRTGCAESVPAGAPVSRGKRKKKTVAA